MRSQWSDKDAERMIAMHAARGISSDLALRVYTSRLLGQEKSLVLHGGGNTSVKTCLPDLLGEKQQVICVKGSGWDLASIEAEGLPAVRLAPLLRLEARDALADEDMVRILRACLLDPMAPNPSVETLLHAFLPHRFIDHTHASAFLALSNLDDGEQRCRELFGERVAHVPFIMPGFELACVAARMYRKQPEVEGLLLHRHGLFTFGESARQAYERMIELVDLAEQALREGKRPLHPSTELPTDVPPAADIAPSIRGACNRHGVRLVMEFRRNETILRFVNGRDLARYAQQGVITPDHIIRTKNKPLLLPAPSGSIDDFAGLVEQAVDAYVEAYRAYFERENARQPGERRMLDPLPRVVLVPGVGLFALGEDRRAAGIVGDLAEESMRCILQAEGLGEYRALPERELFAMEYWSLEQAKLGRRAPLPLAGQVAVITGAGGAIGAATARLFARRGAHVALLDVDAEAIDGLAEEIGERALALRCDVNDADTVATAFSRCCEHFGGVDILVSNAGAAWEGPIDTLDESLLRQSFELNFFAHQRLAQHAVRIMKQQGNGGVLLFNASKQAVNPGENFGAYGLPKAATLFLSRQYALECGRFGIRSNAVNADRVRSGLLDEARIRSRARARGVSEDEYLRGNLLRREVTAEDVAQAFLHLALSEKTTAAVATVDGGNIAAALR